MIELISVHVPKCAGTSLRSALQAAYGPDAVHLDYADRPIDPASPMNLDPEGFFETFRRDGYPFLEGKRAVHGHFHVGKYAYLPARRRVTFLRHPVDRLVSHYEFWRSLPPHGHALHQYVLDSGIDVIGFAQLPMMRFFYSRAFFGGVDMNAFDLIGSVECMDRDVGVLADLIGHRLPIAVENAGASSRASGPPCATSGDACLRDALAGILGDDIAFYERWVGRHGG